MISATTTVVSSFGGMSPRNSPTAVKIGVHDLGGGTLVHLVDHLEQALNPEFAQQRILPPRSLRR